MSSSHPTPKKWKQDTPRLLRRQAGKERGGSPKRQPLQSPRANAGEREGGHTGRVLPPGLPCVSPRHSKAPPDSGSRTASGLPGPPPLHGQDLLREGARRNQERKVTPFPGQKQCEPPETSAGRHSPRSCPQPGTATRHAAPQLCPPRSPALACVFPLPPTQALLPTALPGQS